MRSPIIIADNNKTIIGVVTIITDAEIGEALDRIRAGAKGLADAITAAAAK